MSKVKQDIMRAALERIAAAKPIGSARASDLSYIAALALKDAAAVIEHRITARTWWGSGGCNYVAELRETDSGNIVFEVKGAGGASAWEYAMRDRMVAAVTLFPALQIENQSPTIYFRDVAHVPYNHIEVQRKKDL